MRLIAVLLLVGLPLLTGCEKEPDVKDFGTVIYELPNDLPNPPDTLTELAEPAPPNSAVPMNDLAPPEDDRSSGDAVSSDSPNDNVTPGDAVLPEDRAENAP